MNTKRGFAPLLIIAAIAILAIGGGVYFYSTNKPTPPIENKTITSSSTANTATSTLTSKTDSDSGKATTSTFSEKSCNYHIKADGLYWRGCGIIAQGTSYDDWPLQKIESGNKTDFTILPERFAKSKNNVYLYGSPITTLDPSTFSIISTSTIFVKDSKAVYFVSDLSGNSGVGIGSIHADLTKLDGVDPATFKILSESYLSDKNGVYFYNPSFGFSINKLERADSSSFTILPGHITTGKKGVSQYSKDSKHVYFKVDLVVGADPSSFSTIGSSGYSKDKLSVFYYGKKLDGADLQTFQLITTPVWWAGSLAKDKNQVYGIYPDDNKVTGVDPNTLILYPLTSTSTSFFAKDAHDAFLIKQADDFGGARWEQLDGVDVASFTGLNDFYAKDKFAVYKKADNKRGVTKLSGVDPMTFKIPQ